MLQAAVARVAPSVRAASFYAEYKGHPIGDLELVYNHLRHDLHKRIIWLCGDSSVDCKHWLYPNGDKRQVLPCRMLPHEICC